jgi:HK97 family phage prohead protease
MDRIICAFECKADNSNDGTINGYGSIFGNIDSYGDIVAAGSFKKTINDVMTGAKSWPPMMLQHGDDTSAGRSPIGIWTSMEEDSTGLRLQGKLANTTRGREAYELLKMKPRPALNGLSIGYQCTDYEMHKAGSPARRTIKAVNLIEVSLVTFPANSRAVVTSVKAYSEPMPEPVVDWKAVARADYDRLAKEITKHNRNWR